MPRRKVGNASADSHETTAKKSKTSVTKLDPSPQINGIKVYWEYEESRKWLPFSESLSELLTDRYNGGDTEVEVTDGKPGKLLVYLDRLVQKNKRSSSEKRIRCCLLDETKDAFYSWQWQGEKGKWEMFSVLSCLVLENAYQRGMPSVDIVSSNHSLAINLKNMSQTNVATSETRKIQRIQSDCRAPAAACNVLTDLCVSSSSGGSTTNSNGVTDLVLPETLEQKKNCKRSASSGTRKIKKEPPDSAVPQEDCNTQKNIKTIVMNGKAPVDSECPLQGRVHVYCQGNDVWDCMLNQTNTADNNNKYYLVQLLQENSSQCYYVWQRWGRVGYKGQNNLVCCSNDLNKAVSVFTKKFHDKTKNEWSERQNFQKVPGKYDLIHMDYSTQSKDDVDSVALKKEPTEVPDSKLTQNVQKLIKLISDIQSMKETVIEMKYDAKKAPLGRLTVEQINAGYIALKKIVNCIQSNNFGPNLTAACDEFYTRIPHTFGMKKPPLIRDSQTVKQKIQLLEALGDIEIAINILKQGDITENPIDRTYKSLECEIESLSQNSTEYKLVETYLLNTHAATHTGYSMKLLEVFSCHKSAETSQFLDYGNRMLLWHGSRLTNWVGILSRGLRIAPPEAPVTGYMFGKGVYFADMSSKSANYCFATRTRNIGLALLCEVSLGESHQLLEANYYADKLPPGKHSVKGMGRVAPDPTCIQTLPNGTVVPLGRGIDTGVSNPCGYTLNYNEYIIYDTRQVKMRYLVKIQFDFK